MTNETYDKLKFMAMVILPAIATLYITLANVWGLPYPKEIGATITAIVTFLGVALKVSSDNYAKEK